MRLLLGCRVWGLKHYSLRAHVGEGKGKRKLVSCPGLAGNERKS